MENEYGVSTDTQFAVQISTEVRIQNLDTFALKSDVKASGKEEAQKGKVKRETFPEFMARNPHFFSEQEDRPHQPYPPCRPGYRRVMDLRSGLTFEVAKANLSQKEKEKIALENPQGWNPSLIETRGDYHSRRYMESLHVPPLHWHQKVKIY
jgi:hypothetical protein